jgi:flagellar biosynthesis anti-sigma factor FlgM
MTDAISQLNKPVTPAAVSAEKPKQAAPEAPAAEAPKIERRADEFVLSAQAEKELSSAEFDEVLVSRIKTAIAEGNYPVDAKKVAEKFVALESMIYGK